MKKFTRKLGLLFTIFALSSSLFAENVDVKSIVNSKYYDELIKNGSVIISRDNGSKDLVLLPKTQKNQNIMDSLVLKKEKDYPFTYEALYLLNKNDLLKASNSSAGKIDITDVSRVCRTVSKMQGMKYYSTTRKKEMVLYDKAYTIKDAQSKEAIPDQNIGNADGKVLYCLQDDSSFGVTRYELHYFQSENELLARFVNKDVMGIGPVKAIYQDNLVINLLVEDCGDSLLLYICADLDSVKFPGIKGQITDSISSRMDALYKWFIKQF